MKERWTGERLETFLQDQTAIEHLHRYAIACDQAAGKKILDLACGEGYGSRLLAERADQVVGMDIDEATIRRAAARYQRPNLRFQTAAAEKIPAEAGSFDLVVSFETLEHTDNHEAMLSEIKRVLKPGGTLMLSTPEKKFYSDQTGYQNPFHKKELYESELGELMARYFMHFQVYAQRYCTGSLLVDRTGGGLNLYRGNFEAVEKLPAVDPVYLLVIASDSLVPAIGSSVFDGSLLLDKARQNEARAIRQTLTYRLGHIILWPFKWVRRWIT